jgi:hypothetical protein
VPSGFSNWPTAAQYAAETGSAIIDVTSMARDDFLQSFTPPGGVSAAGFKTLMDATVSGGISSLVSSLSGGTTNPAVNGAVIKLISMMESVLDSALDVVVDSVGKSISGVLGEVASVIPALGQIVGIVLNFITDLSAALDTEAENARHAQAVNEARRVWATECRNMNLWSDTQCRSVPTGVDDRGATIVTPADMFRPVLYSIYGTEPLPFCSIMSFLWLCGGETQGATMSRVRYETILNDERRKQGIPNLGIPKEVQRRMWSLIKGLCKSVQSPASETAIIGDQGRSLYPLLLDIVYQYWKFPARARALPSEGCWTEKLLKRLAWEMSTAHTVNWFGPVNGVETSGRWSGRCADVIDVIGSQSDYTGFFGMLQSYQTGLRNKFGRPDGTIGSGVTNAGVKRTIASVKKQGVVVVSKDQADKFIARVGGSRLTSSQKAAVAASAIGGSYLAWEVVRRLISKGT